jgi:hypothetical protein
MDTHPGRSVQALEEKYRRWKETHLLIGDVDSTLPLDLLLRTLDNDRLLAAHNEAMVGLMAERLLAHTNPVDNFRYAVGLTTELLIRRGIHGRQKMEIQTKPRLDDQ